MDNEQGIGAKIRQLTLQQGIKIELAAPCTPEQNRGSERSGRMISERARALLLEANLPKKL